MLEEAASERYNDPVHSRRCWRSGDALGPLTDGSSARNNRHTVVWINRGFRTVPPDKMCKIS